MILFSSAGWASDALYLLDVQTKQCLPVDPSLKSRPAMAVKDFPHVNREFLKKNPFCRAWQSCATGDEKDCFLQERLTCLNYDRMQTLIARAHLPLGPHSTSILSGEFGEKAAKACVGREATRFPVDSISNVAQNLAGQFKTYPSETKLIVEAVAATKRLRERELVASQMAMAALEQCLQYDVDSLSGSGRPHLASEQKLSQYQTAVKSGAKVPPHCEHLWKADSEMKDLIPQLKKMRLALFVVNYLESKKGDENELVKLAQDLSDERPLTENQKQALRQTSLRHSKGGLFGKLESSFWEETPDQLAALNEHEKKALLGFLQESQSSFSGKASSFGGKKVLNHFFTDEFVSKIADSARFHYFSSISNSPILTYFASSRPDEQETLAAFQKHRRKSDLADKARAPTQDAENLNYPALLQAHLKTLDPRDVGDLCLLASAVIDSNHAMVEAPENLVFAVAMTAGGVAALEAKAILPRLMAFISAAPGLNTAASIFRMEKSAMAYRAKRNECNQTYLNSNGICDVNQMEVQQSSLMLDVVMFATFGSLSAVQRLRSAL